MDKIRKIAEAIRILKVLSTVGIVFNSYMIYIFLMWVMTSSNADSVGEGVAITGIVGALSLNYRFLFQFALRGTTPEIIKAE